MSPLRLAPVLLPAAVITAMASPAPAQLAGKKPITQEVYEIWRSIEGEGLSPDGRWVSWTLAPQVGDGELVIRAVGSDTEYRVPRGFVGRPQLEPSADSGFRPPAARFTADSRYALFLAYPPQSEYDAARRRKEKGASRPKPSLGIVRTEDGAVTLIPGIRSFRIAEDASRYVAYLMAPDSAAKDSTGADSAAAPAVAAAAPGEEPRPVSADTTGAPVKKKEYGTTLVLRDLATGTETRIADVLAYTMDDPGRWLAYTVSSQTPGRDGAYVRSLPGGEEHALLTGAGHYTQLALDEDGQRVAFMSDRDDFPGEDARYTLYLATLDDSPIAVPVVTPDALGGRGEGEYIVSEDADVEFSKDAATIIFGVAPPPLDSIPADSLEDKAVFDLWHYRDLRLQPQQRVEARRDRNRAFTAVYQIRPEKLVRLGNDTLIDIELSDNGRVALAETSLPYSVSSMWGEGGEDIYAIDAMTGERRMVADRVEFGASLSPAGGYVIYFDEGRWLAFSVANGRTTDLTGALGDVRFDQETWDRPSTPEPWGLAGWTTDDRSVLLYDRYDIWEVDPTGERAPRSITDSVGVRERVVFRVADLDEESDFIDPSAPLLLRAFDEQTKASGFYSDRLGADRPPGRIVMANVAFGRPQKAENADVYLVTRSTFREFPDLWVGSDLTDLERISNANPQQSEYPWGTVELVHWYNSDGVPLAGLLYKPEAFDPAKKYPMVVYFYEQMSDNLHRYHEPFGRNTVNPTVYTSLGYLVFFPDIAYTQGYPGPSALKAIVPGVAKLVDEGFVDRNAIGIAGQSWGGYQTAYIITQTNLFAAAVPNATVANMTSAYGGIRWASGRSRSFQYEKTQSRIGGSLWEYPERYIENSPLFFADRIETPVLMMHNDADGAVPWYQSIEFFVALRRLGKEAYFVNYNGESHNPTKRANQMDIDMRMQQFFAHHLKGEPAPDWMQEGIPFLRKGRDQLAPPEPARTSEPAITTGEQGQTGERAAREP
ncbi:MAG: S9 family peptidase [Gemmatimonadaceae bacterium]